MVGFISEENVNDIRHKADIVDIIGRYVSLKKAGNNYLGLCPFHQEKTPSFNVDPATQLFYCFGCQTGGNVFNFLMKKEGWSFPETLRFLARELNIDIPEEDSKRASEQEKLFKLNDYILRFYQYNLEQQAGYRAKDYLKKRGFSKAIIETARLGYAPNQWDSVIKLARKKNIPLHYLQDVGLIISRNEKSGHYDRFRDRIIFPIRDVLGRVIGFGGRVVDSGNPKYMNSPETKLYHKGKTLYGLYSARESIRKENVAILMEGYLDVLASWQYGIENAVASLGTSLTAAQGKLLRRYADNCIICYDADTAGAKASLKGMDVLSKSGINVQVCTLPRGLDPDDYLREEGAEQFKIDILDTATSIVEYRVKSLVSNYDLDALSGRIDFANALVPILAEIENRVEQAGYIKAFAEKYNLHENALHLEVQKYVFSNKDKYKRERNTRVDIEYNETLGNNKRENKLEQDLLHTLVYNSQYLQEVSRECFSDEVHRGLFDKLASMGNYTIDTLLEGNIAEDEAKLLARFSMSKPVGYDVKKTIVALRVAKIDRNIEKLRKEIRELEKVGEFPVEMLHDIAILQKERTKLIGI